ncbi:HA1F protein, partial [Melanocharis versteri]|nr:HA1F protein [Melanocharis versteri]
LQQVCSCDLLFNGNIHGICGEGYDGWDFIFKLGSTSMVVSDGAAWITWRCWESEGLVADHKMNYLEDTYMEWLISWMDFSIIPFPEGLDIQVYRKVEHRILALSCHTYRFCPSTIRISWMYQMKGEEIQDQEIEWGGIIPNSNGAFHTWARTEALPGEREQHQCQVEHPRMLEPGIFIW